MYKRFFYFILFTFHFSLFTFHCFAQDHPATNNPVLPFQTNASDNNDEQVAMQFFMGKEYAKAADVFERLYSVKPSYYIYSYYLLSLVEIGDFPRLKKLVKSAQKNERNP